MVRRTKKNYITFDPQFVEIDELEPIGSTVEIGESEAEYEITKLLVNGQLHSALENSEELRAKLVSFGKQAVAEHGVDWNDYATAYYAANAG